MQHHTQLALNNILPTMMLSTGMTEREFSNNTSYLGWLPEVSWWAGTGPHYVLLQNRQTCLMYSANVEIVPDSITAVLSKNV